MYKLLLCLRYLRTRYIALASIISVTLGVATMIVVNSVMAGFSHEMRDRIHGILADVILEANDMRGAPDPEKLMADIDQAAGEYIEAMSPTVEIYGMLTLEFGYSGNYMTRPITLVGIKPESKGRVGPLREYLETYQPLFEDGELVRPAQRPRSGRLGWELTADALEHRRRWRMREQFVLERTHIPHAPAEGVLGEDDGLMSGEAISHAPPFGEPPPFADPPTDPEAPVEAPRPRDGDPGSDPLDDSGLPRFVQNPFADDRQQLANPWDDTGGAADLAALREGRLYVGVGLISYLEEDRETGRTRTQMMVRPGDDVRISTVTAGGDRAPPKAAHDYATIVDVFKSGMSEYDSNLVYCNLEWLQKIRGMLVPDGQTGGLHPGQSVSVRADGRDLSGYVAGFQQDGAFVVVDLDPAQPVSGRIIAPRGDVRGTVRSITSIQIKLKNFDDAPEVVQRLQAAFQPGWFSVRTWEQKQGPLLAAVEVESAILNVLLFLIIAVAGFGILAIFFMIVVEKTRDIGILKALGASSGGVMSIFLSYGLALGVVGSGVGVVLGLLFVRYINTIEGWITWITGRKVFDEKIYYFPEIPTSVSPLMVTWVAVGAMTIAVLASVLPARRAARLHPVRALRYE